MNGRTALSLIVVMLLLTSSLMFFIPAASADDSIEDTELPSSFDQRDMGIVTPPKLQSPWGTCWAFAGTGAAETAILTAIGKTYEETGLDLSERHVSYFSNTPVSEPITETQVGEGLHPISDDPNAPFMTGGYPYDYAQLFSTGVGPVSEEWYPYHGKESISQLSFYEDRELCEPYVREKYADIEELIPFLTDEGREELFDKWIQDGLVFPPGVDASNFTFDDYVDAVINYNIDFYQKQDVYSEFDDWTLDISERNYTMGYMMTDGNRMDNPRIIENGQWKGVDWNAVDDIKSELLLGHGLVVCYNSNSVGYSEEFASHYQTDTLMGHVVQLIGWDDSFPKEHFNMQPEGDGAWLCKNSWGSETYGYEVNGKTYYEPWGIVDENGKHTGYFWLSFYDRSLQGVESLSFSDKMFDVEEYMYYIYDFLPDGVNSYWTYDEPVAMANVFTADSRMDISGISIYTRENGSHASVRVYADPKQGDPTSGKLVYETSCSFLYAGIHLIYPDKWVEIQNGQRFSVVFEEQTPDGYYVMGMNSFIDEEKAKGGKIYGVSVINRGESFLFEDEKWYDWVDVVDGIAAKNPGYAYDNFSIKVFSVDSPVDNGHPEFVAVAAGLVVAEAIALLFLMRRR